MKAGLEERVLVLCAKVYARLYLLINELSIFLIIVSFQSERSEVVLALLLESLHAHRTGRLELSEGVLGLELDGGFVGSPLHLFGQELLEFGFGGAFAQLGAEAVLEVFLFEENGGELVDPALPGCFFHHGAGLHQVLALLGVGLDQSLLHFLHFIRSGSGSKKPS